MNNEEMTPEEQEAWAELERKQLYTAKFANKMKNKDILFSHWYDNLEGTKSQGFAYKAWCAGWSAAQKESTLQEISDIGHEIEQEPVAFLNYDNTLTIVGTIPKSDTPIPLYLHSERNE